MLEVCDELGYPVFIVTKSDLVARDKDILASLAKSNLAAVNFTITAVKAKLLGKLEPQSPSNNRRFEAMKTLTQAGVPCNLYLSPIFPHISDELIPSILKKVSQNGAKCCAAIFLKIRPVLWNTFREFLQSNNSSLVKECDMMIMKGDAPDTVATYQNLYFKNGGRDLSGYLLPELSYRRGMMEFIAEKRKQYHMCFTAEEFLDLWTTPYSDCVSFDSWHAPTAYDIVKFMKSQGLQTPVWKRQLNTSRRILRQTRNGRS